jgi:F0F1-type ATP synthase epsilon subunit
MNLKVLLPFQIFAEKTGVSRMVAETREGSFGLCHTDWTALRRSRPGF